MSSSSRARRWPGLWRHPDFLKLWAGQSVSAFGTLITNVALPIAAVLALRATPAQVALIYAAEIAPTLALALPAGALADRLRRRPLLIAADVGRGLALAAIPIAAALGALSLPLIYCVALVVSALSVVFDTAWPAYLPSLIGRERLLEGNAKLGASLSVAEAAGFGLAGILAQLFTAPGAIVADVATYVVSVISLGAIRAREPAPGRETADGGLAAWRAEVAEGLRLTWRNPTLRALAGAAAARSLGGGIIETTLLIFILRDLRIAPAVMGLIFGVGGVTSFVGATLAPRVTRWLGMRRALRLGAWAYALLGLLMPLAGGPLWLAVTLLVIPQLGDAANTIYEIAATTTTQRLSPHAALGRVIASARFVAGVAMVVGLGLGAALGQALGARGALLVAMVGLLLGPLWLTLAPIAPDETTVAAAR